MEVETNINLFVNGHEVSMPAGSSVAAAIVVAGQRAFRYSVSGEPRAALCAMGICHECRVTIDDTPHRLACQTVCRTGMKVSIENGA